MSEAPVAEAQVNGENADAQPEENAVEEDQPKLDDQGQVKDAAAEEQPTTGEKADDAAAEVEPQPEVPKQEGMYEKLEAGPTSKGWKYRGPAAERAARKEYAGVIAVPSEGMYEKPEAGTSSQPWTYRGPAAERRAWRKSNNLPSESEDEEELEPLEPRLLAAFEANDAGVIAELVEESSNGVAALVNDQKLLHKACLLGFSDIVKIFLTLEKLSGEDVDEKSRTCLHCALDAPFEQRKSVAVPVIDALHSRLNSENLASVVNSPDSLGRTCVDMAASHSGEGMLLEKILFLKGNPNAVNKKSKPPLALAAMAGLPAHIKALCAAKADVNAEFQDEANGTSSALLYAAMEGHSKVVQALLNANADVNVVDMANGNTPREWAKSLQHRKCEWLLEQAEVAATRNANKEASSENPFNLFNESAQSLSEQAAATSKSLISPEVLEERKQIINDQNRAFISSTENQFKPLLQCFLRHIFKDRPDDVTQYAAQFFSRLDLPELVKVAAPTQS